MEVFGVCNQSLAAVRKQPGEPYEMINQLIFGDLLEIKAKVNSWLLIESMHDGYEGWVDSKQVKQINNTEYQLLVNSSKAFTTSIITKVDLTHVEGSRYLSLGSRLYQVKQNTFNNLEGEGVYTGEIITNPSNGSGEQVAQAARQYLNAPYLWGGRSVWGIDCSGLVQMSFLLNGYSLPRDAGQQAQIGETVHFIHEIKAGDLIFFDNEEGKIVHVGIALPNKNIIHASGQVRIDTLDHQGIFQQQTHLYTHQLRLIKRMIT